MPDRARARRRLLADDRQQRQPVPVHQGSAADRHRARRPTRRPASRRRRARPDSGEPALSDRPEHPEAVSAAERRQRPASAYNYELTRPDREAARVAAGGAPRLPADRRTLRGTFKYSGWAQQDADHPGHDPRLQRHAACTTRSCSTMATTVNYTLNPTTFLEGTYGHSQNELAGCALAQAGTGPNFCTRRVPDEPTSRTAQRRARRAAVPVPGRQRDRPELLRVRGAERRQPADLGRQRGSRCRRRSRGAAASPTRRRTSPFPGFLNINATNDVVDQPDQGLRAGTRSRPGSTTRTATRRSSASGWTVRHAQLRATTPTTRSTRSSASPTRRSASSAPTTRRRSTSRAATSTTTPRATSRTTGR